MSIISTINVVEKDEKDILHITAFTNDDYGDEEAEAFKNYVLSGKLRIKPQFTDENHRKNFLVVAAIKSGRNLAADCPSVDRCASSLARKDGSFQVVCLPLRELPNSAVRCIEQQLDGVAN